MLNGEVGLGGDPEFTHEYVLVFLSSLVGFFWQVRSPRHLPTISPHLPTIYPPSTHHLHRLHHRHLHRHLPTISLAFHHWQALIVASLTAFLDHVGKSGKQYRENVDQLRQYVKRHRLPHELRERLLLYYQVRCYPL